MQRYYILESEYSKLIKLGIPLCNIVEKDYWIKKDRKNYQLLLNEESILHKLGYNVNASINLPASKRHQILEAVIVNGILSKAEVSFHLDYLINRSKNNPSLRSAVSKWQDDREYINEIVTTATAEKYKARSITHSNYHYNS